MNVHPEIKSLIDTLVTEFISNHMAFIDSPESYLKGERAKGILFISIDSRSHINDENKIVVPQLYHSKETTEGMRSLAESIQSLCDLKCYPSELHHYLEGFFCKLINEIVVSKDSNRDGLVSNLLRRELKIIRKEILHEVEFCFPCNAMGLTETVKLSEQISIALSKEDDLNEVRKKSYLHDRHHLNNAYLKISLKGKMGQELGLNVARNVSRFVANLINIDAHLMQLKVMPCVTSDARLKNTFDFYQVVGADGKVSNSVTYNFPYDLKSCSYYWRRIIEHASSSLSHPESDVVAEILSLCVTEGESRRVVDIIINAINWYGDAYTETNLESQIVKCTTAIESLVNYEKSDGQLTQTIINRVCKMRNAELDSEIHKQISSLYNARSEIVHGSRLKEVLTFCPLKFCRETIYAAMSALKGFELGLGGEGYAKKLAQYIDGLEVAAPVDELGGHCDPHKVQGQ